MQARMVNQSLFSGVRGKGAFMWLAVKSIKNRRQRGDLERKEACSILVISKLHRPLLTLLIRSLGKSHSGRNIFFFLFSCLRLRSQPLCKQSLYAAPQNSAWVAAPLSYCSGRACGAAHAQGLRAYCAGAAESFGLQGTLSLLCKNNWNKEEKYRSWWNRDSFQAKSFHRFLIKMNWIDIRIDVINKCVGHLFKTTKQHRI